MRAWSSIPTASSTPAAVSTGRTPTRGSSFGTLPATTMTVRVIGTSAKPVRSGE
jgi:hypothetical protein